ncbi:MULTISPECIES: ATP-binding protein [Streptomyces]|uniref:ATP-binding protein n=1 Tax=Streptomyces mirabilis TaxID=68239 RepID=A0ABU3UX01_9ACTN|nr:MULTISPECIES: ATP-binding protein [Streptomyces]MCX4607726.1 ATP-binding protein [Streptomyces mirabilis]MCX4617586.1 ATP-binding protein [Streptomyces mirabilis]MCX5348189.1 ATP-binding protein [Streptomyces mirabilis]MCX5356316.1 ATP-binding protein [Streptomyces mirabilis]MCX5356939.1 ATP-binding protein [Streptomyces mirabilis]
MSKPARAQAEEADLRSRLDHLTLSRKEGFQRLADSPPRPRPDLLARRQIKQLGETALEEYNRGRRNWHANLGPLRTPQMNALHEDLWDIFDSNAQDGDKAKGSIALDAFPGLGKTTAVLAFARKLHRRTIREEGELTAASHERWPVCRVGLTANTGMRDFNRAILEYYGHPGRFRGTAAEFGYRALDCVLSAETKLLIVDDLHFLRWRDRSGIEVSNHFKYIANEFPVTLLMIGVGLEAKGLFSEGGSYTNAVLAQTGRRTTPLDLAPFTIDSEQDRTDWRNTLLAIEERVVLAEKHPGMLADNLSDYLFARSTGHIGSLMTLINRGCQRAVRTGAERLDERLLDQVKNDAAAEKARAELEQALASGRLASRPERAA